MTITPLERLMARTTATSDGCLLVNGGAKNKYGYMQINIAGRKHAAHRYAYEQLVGPIPDGLTIDHTCRRPRCINPDHLEPVPAAVNKSRERKPYCRRGHLLAEHGWPNGKACRTCALAVMAEKVPCSECGKQMSRGNLRRHRLSFLGGAA